MTRTHAKRVQITPALREVAVEAVRRGSSFREAGRQVGVAGETVRRWVMAASHPDTPGPPPTPADLPHMSHDVVDVDDLGDQPDETDPLALGRWMLRNANARAAAAERQGNFTAAQRAGRDAAAMLAVVARLEKMAVSDADAVRLSKADIETAMQAVRERIDALATRGLRCSACNRELSVQWGRGESDTDAP